MECTRRSFLAAGVPILLRTLFPGPSTLLQSLNPSLPHLQVFRDTVNVGVVRSGDKALLIDSGSASILRFFKSLGIGSIDWVLYTHHHRDQCCGAGVLKRAGVRIGVPGEEARLFRNATEFWLEADKFIDHRYNFHPDLFVLRNSVAPDHELSAGEIFEWKEINLRVLPTPGHTSGSVSYVVEIDGRVIAFTGDLIYGPGQLWEFYSLQKRFPGMKGDYWGFGGAVTDIKASLETVLSYKPDMLIPSHGSVIENPSQAVGLLDDRLDAVMKNYFTLAAWRLHHFEGSSLFQSDVGPQYAVPMLPPLPRIEVPRWLQKIAETSAYIQAGDGSIFLFDCGFPPVVQDLNRLAASGTISGIDGIWISQYHDDHVQSVNNIRRLYGARVYAQKEIQDILENPRAYCMPALHPETIHIDHPLGEGEAIWWKGFRMSGYYFPGQTIYHAGLLIEHDGARVFLSGDAFMNWAISDVCSYNRNFLGKDGLGKGYERCLRLLQKLKPDLLWAAHYGAVPITEEYLRKTSELLQEREKLLAGMFPWDDANFGLDPLWIRAYPYRQTVFKGQPLALEVRIYNHSDSPRLASVELRAPSGWQTTRPTPMTIATHEEGSIRLQAVAPINPLHDREVLGVTVRLDGRWLEEAAEAIVDYYR